MIEGIADVASLFSCGFIRLNRELSLGAEYKQIVLVSLMICSAAFTAHMIGNMLIAVNRYSAVFLMQRYDTIWSRRNVFILIVVQYGVAFVACIHLAGAEMVYTTNTQGISTYKGVDKHADL
ncbi:hypothetical protein OSTOST_25259, partial [Ostertagia ostertagi]